MRDVYNATSNHQLNSRKYKKFGKNYITNEKLYDVFLLYVGLYDSFSLRLDETEGNLLQHARKFLSRRVKRPRLCTSRACRARFSLVCFSSSTLILSGKFLDDFRMRTRISSTNEDFPASHTIFSQNENEKFSPLCTFHWWKLFASFSHAVKW